MKKHLLVAMYLLGAFVRFWLASSDYQEAIANRIEISTPINSWKRVTESLYLESISIHPYLADTFHESPIHLAAYRIIFARCRQHFPLVFVACEIATTLLLHLFAIKFKLYIQNFEEAYLKQHDQKTGFTKINSDRFISPEFVAAAYLFNPYVILNCVGHTTTVFANFFAALFLTGLIYGQLLLTTTALAICIFQNLYYVSLISPLIIVFSNKGTALRKPITAVILLAISLIMLMYYSYYLNKSWNFLNNTFGFVLTVPDLRPNIGLFWYFFAEVFDHFRLLFLYAFQINATFLYLIPLSIRLHKEPMLLAASCIILISIFKSYPCLGDVGFSFSVLCCWKHLFQYTQQNFIEGSSLLVISALAPTFWNLWIYSGSANVNYYFAVTLVFATALIFMLTDMLFAYMKREYELIYGCIMNNNDGDDVKIELAI